ncbi:MAG TPA: ABC transporter substrate-binding protein, partial [Blastocatellia bacterium]|nr:ABC transporter substrate-binding protein [Blastocatellia bacterium]
PPGYDAGVCTKWEADPGGKQWTFYLRKGVRWSDGASFTADDVVFTYNVMLDEKVDTPIRSFFSEGKGEDGKDMYPTVEKLDDHTVRFNLHKPNGSFLDSIFNLFLIPQHRWEGAWRAGTFNETMKPSDDPASIVGLGPFVIKEYVTGQRVVLERNPHYWKVDSNRQRLPYLDRLVFVIAKSFDTVLAKFQAGEIDAMSRVRATDYSVVKPLESPTVRVEEVGVSHDTNWIIINQNAGTNPKTGKPIVVPWKQRLYRDQKFRQAVSFAIDREALANAVYAGRGLPIYSFVSPAASYWYSDDIMKYPHDPSRARQMLAEIGLKDTNGDGILEDAEGHKVELRISCNASNSQRVDTATLIAKNLRDVGIDSSPAPVSLQLLANSLQSTFDFDAIVLGWQVNPPPGPGGTANMLLSSALNHASYPNQKTPSTEWEARIDELVYKIASTVDQEEQRQMYAEIQRIWSEQLPEINLISQREAVAYKNKFGNLHPVSLQPRFTWNVEEIYVKK